MSLLSHIQILEKLDDDRRFNYIIEQLTEMEYPFRLQHYEVGTNIIVPAAKKPFTIVASHFDTFQNATKRTPGANDNASAIAVCLELLRKKKESSIPILGIDFQVIFFDGEEIGLKGSKAYVTAFGIEDCSGLLNMELVGMGNRFALWPLSLTSEGPLLSRFEKVANKMGIDCFRIDKIVTNSADHQSFLNAGLKDAFTITCISRADLEAAVHYIQAVELDADMDVLLEIMQKAPIFQHYHQTSDTSEKLSEAALQMTLEAIWNTLLMC